jgi:MFS family permease
VVYGLLLGSATAGASISLSNAIVAQWFPPQRRAFAISLNNGTVALGRLALIYISYALLESHGWRLSHVYLGAMVLVLAVPAALLMPQHRVPAGTAGAAGQQSAVPAPLEVTRWHESLRSAPIWQIMGGYFVCGMTVNLSIYLIPFATDRGFLQADAVKAMSFMAVCSFLGSIMSGVISDRIGRKNVLALAYAIRAVAFGILLVWHDPRALFLFALLGGVSWLATPPSVMALTGEIYGMRTIGTIGGISLLAHQLGGGASVWLAGKLRDLTGSYDVSFTLAIIALVGATLVSFIISERRYSVRYSTSVPSAAGN